VAEAVADSSAVVRQAVNGWRRKEHQNSGEGDGRKDDIEKSSSISRSPDQTASTSRDLHEIILSPAGLIKFKQIIKIKPCKLYCKLGGIKCEG
jgi:hypothetical protein